MYNYAFDAAYQSYLALEPALKHNPNLANLSETLRITLLLRNPIDGLTLVRLCDIIIANGGAASKVREDVLAYLKNDAPKTYGEIIEILESERLSCENRLLPEQVTP